MSVPLCFRCPACGDLHGSRIRVQSLSWLEFRAPALVDVLELCPGTGHWVRVVLLSPEAEVGGADPSPDVLP